MGRVLRVQCLAVVSMLAVALVANAGERSCRIGVVNLDENGKSTRFASLQRSLAELLKPRAQDGDGIVAAIEIPRGQLKGALKPGCTLALPETAPVWGEREVDFIALYCANGDASSIEIALYRRGDANARLTVMLAPRDGAVGQKVIKDLAGALLHFADTLFSP